MFSIGASVYALGGLLFILFGEGKIQPWNEKKENEETNTQQ